MTDTAPEVSGFVPVPQEAAFTKEEENVAKARLFALLARQARLRTQGDHSSLREEDAAELLESNVFTLRVHLRRNGLPMHELLTADLRAMLERGQAALLHELDTAKTLYQVALRSVQTFGSRALADTLGGIGLFFKRYDHRLHAHQIPASIDYQLCAPVPDELRGVLYIRDYLEWLLIENGLVTKFAPTRVAALLSRAAPDYRDLLINLYEPVAANAVGLSLLGGDIATLAMTRAQAEEIHRALVPLPPSVARERLEAAARGACQRLSFPDGKPVFYLSRAAAALYPRIVISPGSASAVFSAHLAVYAD